MLKILQQMQVGSEDHTDITWVSSETSYFSYSAAGWARILPLRCNIPIL